MIRHASDFICETLLPDDNLALVAGIAETIFSTGQAAFLARCRRLGLSAHQAADALATARTRFEFGTSLCESPIEKIVLAAMLAVDWPGLLTIPPLVHDGRRDALLPNGDVVIIPQMAFLRYRADFGVLVDKGGRRRLSVVECDGEEFHQDAGRQRARDAYFQSWDVKSFRLTGSEIHQDALGAVGRIVAEVSA